MDHNRDFGINRIKARKNHCCYGMAWVLSSWMTSILVFPATSETPALTPTRFNTKSWKALISRPWCSGKTSLHVWSR